MIKHVHVFTTPEHEHAAIMWAFKTHTSLEGILIFASPFAQKCLRVLSALCVFCLRTAAAVHITQWSPDGEYFATAGKVPHTHTSCISWWTSVVLK